MRKAVRVILGIGALIGVGLVAADARAGYEEPAYKVSLTEGNFELRDYPSVVSATVEVQGGRDAAANQAFKILAGYIFGKNVSKKQIAMTVPVTSEAVSEKIAMTVPVTEEKSGSSMRMSFYMPAKYTLESLPEPLDKRIQFKQIAARKFAVVRFSGWATEDSIESHTVKLRAFIEKKGLTASADPITAFYNPPWTLPFLRRNEVWIEVSP
jgi:hypothetical protein